MYPARTRGRTKLSKRQSQPIAWTPGRAHTHVERDWLGRRIDLRDFHRDPTCGTHQDPLLPCTCHALFRQWDWVIDWIFCCGLVGAIILLLLVLPMIFSRSS